MDEPPCREGVNVGAQKPSGHAVAPPARPPGDEPLTLHLREGGLHELLADSGFQGCGSDMGERVPVGPVVADVDEAPFGVGRRPGLGPACFVRLELRRSLPESGGFRLGEELLFVRHVGSVE